MTPAYFAYPTCIGPKEVEDLEEYFCRSTVLVRQSLVEEIEPLKFFKSFRSIMDMENFCETRNTYTFWKDYIKQLWDQSGQAEREKLWLNLNDLLNYVSKPC